MTALSAASLNAYILRLKPCHGSSVRGLATVQPARVVMHRITRPARQVVGLNRMNGRLDGTRTVRSAALAWFLAQGYAKSAAQPTDAYRLGRSRLHCTKSRRYNVGQLKP